MSETMARPTTRASDLSAETIASYRRDGFVRIPRVFDEQRTARFAAAAMSARERLSDHNAGHAVFAQLLQLWQHDDVLRELTLDAELARIATVLAGVPLRLWHDQLLIKDPHNGARTEYHQDNPYWPHAPNRHALSAWVALVDVPVERGCMTFIPGQQDVYRNLRPQDLEDGEDLFGLAPELRYAPRHTLPLRAGDCTFHHSFTPHTANANATGDPRIAQVVIYVDQETRFAELAHPVTNGLGLAPGDRLPDDAFPPLP